VVGRDGGDVFVVGEWIHTPVHAPSPLLTECAPTATHHITSHHINHLMKHQSSSPLIPSGDAVKEWVWVGRVLGVVGLGLGVGVCVKVCKRIVTMSVLAFFHAGRRALNAD
jgi:hypothetical protein